MSLFAWIAALECHLLRMDPRAVIYPRSLAVRGGVRANRGSLSRCNVARRRPCDAFVRRRAEENLAESKERWREPCKRAVVEQDPDLFLATIQELIQALEDHEQRRRNTTGLRSVISNEVIDYIEPIRDEQVDVQTLLENGIDQALRRATASHKEK